MPLSHGNKTVYKNWNQNERKKRLKIKTYTNKKRITENTKSPKQIGRTNKKDVNKRQLSKSSIK